MEFYTKVAFKYKYYVIIVPRNNYTITRNQDLILKLTFSSFQIHKAIILKIMFKFEVLIHYLKC